MGQVTASFGGLKFVTYCQLGNTANGIGPDACKAIYALLLAARISGATVNQTFNDSSTCAAHPSWSYLNMTWGGPSL
jgi:hypothetical protein